MRLFTSRLTASPFSDALIPLSVGLRRKFMLQSGAREHDVRLRGSSVHYYHAQGRTKLPIILVHGIADNATTWAHVLLPLRRVGEVYALDLPGFGHSRAPVGSDFVPIDEMTLLLEEFIEKVVGGPALLVGNSMGAWMGLLIGLRRPDLLRGIVAINPGGAPLGGRESWQPFIDMARVPDLRAVRQIYRGMFARPPIRLPLYAGQRGFQRLFSQAAVQHILERTVEKDFLEAEELCALSVPLAIIWGTADRFLPPGSLEFFQRCLPHARWLLLPVTGHLPQIERPGRVAAFVRVFARELSAPPRKRPLLAALVALLLQRPLLRRPE